MRDYLDVVRGKAAGLDNFGFKSPELFPLELRKIEI